MLDLPQKKVVLQLPAIVDQQGWLLNYVADNYRRNGFRVAVNAVDAQEALALLRRVRADVVKVDGREISDEAAAQRLVDACANENVQVIFKRIENERVPELLQRLQDRSGYPVHAQGYLWDIPKAALGDALPDAVAVARVPVVSALAVAW